MVSLLSFNTKKRSTSKNWAWQVAETRESAAQQVIRKREGNRTVSMAQHVLRKMLAPWRTPSSYKLFLSHNQKSMPAA